MAKKLNVYRIYTAKSSVLIYAETKREAKARFQERFGYWPDDDQMSESREEEMTARVKETDRG